MALEKRWLARPAQLLILDGTADGKLTVTNAKDLKVKQIILLSSGAVPTLQLQIKRVNSENEIEVGHPKKDIHDRTDVSAYLVADGSSIKSNEQSRPNIAPDDAWRAIFEEEPTVAMRTIGVDRLGVPWSTDNPFPIVIDEVTIPDLNVNLKHNGETPQPNDGDTVAIGNNQTGADARLLEINKNLDIDVRAQGWTIQEKIVDGIMCAYDVNRSFSHTEVDGVYRVTQIEWTSASMDSEAEGIGFITAGQSITVRRTFTYDGSDPFLLEDSVDSLIISGP